MGNILNDIADNLETCNGRILLKTLDDVKDAVNQGISPHQILEKGLLEGLNRVGAKFKVGEVYISEVLAVAKAIHLSMDFLRPLMTQEDVKHRGKILLGTVAGDLHDIGKNLVGIMLEAAGFKIIDIGINVPAGKFVAAAKEKNVEIVGLSSLLTTTMNEMKTVIEAFKSSDLKIKIIVGGAPVTQEFADKIGADAYAINAGEAVEKITDMSDTLSTSARKVQQALEARGLACQVVEMAKTTRSAKDAARAVGCRVEQIVKSLVFKGKNSRKAFLIVASGVNRVNEEKFAELVGEPVEMPDADFVRKNTGFAIGGVPPIAHTIPLQTFIDEDLLNYAEIWAAAGTPRAVFKLTPADLQKITGGQVIRIT